MGIINVRVWARKAHRRLGLGVMIVLMGLSVTGIIMNHPDTYNLHDDYIPFWMSDTFYRSEFPEIRSYPVNERWISQMNNLLYFDGVKQAACIGKFTGAIQTATIFAATCGDQLLLLDAQGQLTRTIHVSETPLTAFTYVFACEGTVCVFERGSTYKLTQNPDPEWTLSTSYSMFPIPKTEPYEIRKEMLEALVAEQFSWQRVVEDLHSGKIGGAWGVLVVDTTWFFTIIICLTGIYIWIVQGRREPW